MRRKPYPYIRTSRSATSRALTTGSETNLRITNEGWATALKTSLTPSDPANGIVSAASVRREEILALLYVPMQISSHCLPDNLSSMRILGIAEYVCKPSARILQLYDPQFRQRL